MSMLGKETDATLAFKVKDIHDEDALIELISRHSGIYVDMIKRYASKSLNETQVLDLIGDKDYNIYQTAIAYDPNKGSKFSTYLANRAKFLCLTGKTEAKKSPRLSDFDECENMLPDPAIDPSEQSLKIESMQKILAEIRSHPDSKVRLIFEERYFNGEGNKLTPWKNIAEKIGMSIQGTMNVHNRVVKEIREKIL